MTTYQNFKVFKLDVSAQRLTNSAKLQLFQVSPFFCWYCCPDVEFYSCSYFHFEQLIKWSFYTAVKNSNSIVKNILLALDSHHQLSNTITKLISLHPSVLNIKILGNCSGISLSAAVVVATGLAAVFRGPPWGGVRQSPAPGTNQLQCGGCI